MRSYNGRTVLKWAWSPGKVWILMSLCICLMLPGVSFAAWSTDPAVNTPVCVAPGNQVVPQIVYDGDGGYFVAWTQESEGDTVYAQHFDCDGNAVWDENGIPVDEGDGFLYGAVADGSGGLIVAWISSHEEEDYTIYAQRLDADGEPVWVEGPVAVIASVPMEVGDDVYGGRVVTDGEGGAFIIGAGGTVSRVTSDGDLWEGTVEYTSNPFISQPKIVSDGAGGAIMAWIDSGDGYVVAMQRVDGSGNLLWGSDGDPIYMPYDYAEADAPRLISTGDGGAIVVWFEDTGEGYEIFAQKVDADGEEQWSDGDWEMIPVAFPNYLDDESLDVASDGQGGIFITWADDDDYTVYAQHVDTSGLLDWEGPVPMSGYDEWDNSSISLRQTIEDGMGGFITTWLGYIPDTPGDPIMAQRCDADGNVLWGEGGIVIANPGKIVGPVLASCGQGGAVVAWFVWKGETGYDVYMQGVNAEGELGRPCGESAPVGYRHHGNSEKLCFVSTAESSSNVTAIFILGAIFLGLCSLIQRRSA